MYKDRSQWTSIFKDLFLRNSLQCWIWKKVHMFLMLVVVLVVLLFSWSKYKSLIGTSMCETLYVGDTWKIVTNTTVAYDRDSFFLESLQLFIKTRLRCKSSWIRFICEHDWYRSRTIRSVFKNSKSVSSRFHWLYENYFCLIFETRAKQSMVWKLMWNSKFKTQPKLNIQTKLLMLSTQGNS